MDGIVAGSIQKVCVIGAGTMGAGIAAQVANAGLEVLLLDIAGEDDKRNLVVEASLARIRKSDPPLLMEPENISRIKIGNIEDDLERIDDCDWVVEAIVERLDVKRDLYRNILPYLKEDALVSSNTSTIPISLLMEGMPGRLSRRFCITHFFNPVRYMRLLELVGGVETDTDALDCLADFCDKQLGKGVVKCADTPGFLGNRVGVFAMQAAIHEAIKLGIDIEDADALFGRPMGIPKTGAFGLYDLIGLDLMADVVRSLRAILPEGDAFHAVGGENELVNSLVERGFNGNKGKGGFYAEADGEKRAIDLVRGEWRARKTRIPDLALAGENTHIGQLVDGEDVLSQFCWRVLARILSYSASLLPDVTHSPQDIDDAMKLGYNWVRGPFEILDELGIGKFVERLEQEGREVPPFLLQGDKKEIYKVIDGRLKVRDWGGEYRDIALAEGITRFHMLRREIEPVAQNASASLFHLNDGVRLVEFHTKANALDGRCMEIVAQAAADPGPGVLVHNDAQHFSAGVNLERFQALINDEDWMGIDAFLHDFQKAVCSLRYCNAPVVGAPSGLAIGGGYEVLAHCDMVVAHANSVLGLVEPLVGLVPGGGGVKETYLRWFRATRDWEKAAWNTFNQIGYARTGSSPAMAAKYRYFLPERDKQVMNRDRLMFEGRQAIFALSQEYKPRPKPVFRLAGEAVFDDMVSFLEKAKSEGKILAHDLRVAREIAAIVTGGAEIHENEVDEEYLFALERKSFIQLARTPQTLTRIDAMLSGNGTVRN